jgi:hypothetical protein
MLKYEVHIQSTMGNRESAFIGRSDRTQRKADGGLRTFLQSISEPDKRQIQIPTGQLFHRPNVPPVQGFYTILPDVELSGLMNSSAIAGTINRIRIQVRVWNFPCPSHRPSLGLGLW